MRRVDNNLKAFLLAVLLLLVLFSALLYPGKAARLWYREHATALPAQDLRLIARQQGLPLPLPRPVLVVSKSNRTLTLYAGGIALKQYRVSLGKNYLQGHKQQEGDERTPEGQYYIGERQIVFPPRAHLGSRWLGISYPNPQDAAAGLQRGLLTPQEYRSIQQTYNKGLLPPQKTALGGEIGIHGGYRPNLPGNWTEGCIALFDWDMEELYAYVPLGTPIRIQR